MTAYSCACSVDWEGAPRTVPCDRGERCSDHRPELRLQAANGVPLDLGIPQVAGGSRASVSMTLIVLSLGAVTMLAALLHNLL